MFTVAPRVLVARNGDSGLTGRWVGELCLVGLFCLVLAVLAGQKAFATLDKI